MNKKLQLKQFAIEELLNREPVHINFHDISKSLQDKKVLVTGASGSIGSELVRQICLFNPKSIILFDRNENNQFFLEKELKEKFPNINIIPRLGSVSDRERVNALFQETRPDIVYHAAANKHVPLSESNPSEAIQNNILGSRIIADAAAYFNCETFVMISTDKAVNPTSVMGATKRIAEYYVQLKGQTCPNTKFVSVRFGNVLGSAGSVVPIFQSQIEAGGPITVTHPDMYRYFMSIPEASQLLLQASTFAESGDIFVLDMGDPIKILDLAKNMILLSGYQPDIDIKINFSGVRPGEKIFEELSFDYESTVSTIHPKIRNTKTPTPNVSVIKDIHNLENLDASIDPNLLKIELSKLIPEAKFGK